MNQIVCSECGAATVHPSLNGLCPRCLFLLASDADATRAETPGRPPEPGETVRYLGDYEILNEIARGGMGAVFRARQVSLNRVVALKLMLSGEYASREERERFQNEAEGAAKLQHPNIVSIHEIGSAHGQPYFSMDFVEGESLAERICGQSPAPMQAAEWMRALAEAVEYAHRQGILHRDLKPQNVLVDKSGRLRITDFGLSKRMDSGSDLTASGAVLGTPGYMAPEQAAGNQEMIGPGTDVYGLGAILYEMLAGQPPFREATAARTIVKVIEQEPVRPSRLAPAVPPDLETIALKCLEKSPSRRYASAQHLADELGRFIRGEPIMAVPATALRRGLSWCTGHPWVLTGTASLLLLSLMGLVFGLWQRNQFLMAKAAGAPIKAMSEMPAAIGMLFSAAGFYACIGLYAIAARRKSRGERLTRSQLGMLGAVGAFQVAASIFSSLLCVSAAAWDQLKGPSAWLFIAMEFVFLWSGVLLCWEALAGNISMRRGIPEVQQKTLPRLKMNMGAAMACLFVFAMLLSAYSKWFIVDRGYDSPFAFRQSNYPAAMTARALNRWWGLHYDSLHDISETFRRDFRMIAMFVAGLLPGLVLIWRDPRGHWRKLLPLGLMMNGAMVVVVARSSTVMPPALLAQAVLLGFLASIVALKVMDIRTTTEPRAYELSRMLPSVPDSIKYAALALAINGVVASAMVSGGVLEVLPVAVFSTFISFFAGVLMPSWRAFSRDDRLALLTGYAALAWGNPAAYMGLLAAFVIYWLRRQPRGP